MRVNFWIKTWDKKNIGFHRADIHPVLEQFWPALEAGASVLVPLCGKSIDLLWLEERGLDVIGVEFVESAVLDFFRENDLSWHETEQDGHRCLCASERNIRIFVTDFIQLAEDYRGEPIKGFYDRAALVALPEDMRGPYVDACRKLLAPSHKGLLVSSEYDSSLMEGPPFSVPRDEVERLWTGELRLVEQMDVVSEMPRAMALGVPCLEEFFWTFE